MTNFQSHHLPCSFRVLAGKLFESVVADFCANIVARRWSLRLWSRRVKCNPLHSHQSHLRHRLHPDNRYRHHHPPNRHTMSTRHPMDRRNAVPVVLHTSRRVYNVDVPNLIDIVKLVIRLCFLTFAKYLLI